MKKQIWILALLIGLLVLTACGGNEAIDSIDPIDNAAWPTPVPPTPRATATPFPVITLEDVTSSKPAGLAVVEPQNKVDVEAQPDRPAPPALPDEAEAVTIEAAVSVEADVAQLQPVAGAEVQSVALNIRQGPGPEFGKFEPLVQGDQLKVLAQSRDRLWLLVEREDGGYGWVDAEYVSLDATPADIPTVVSARPDPGLDSGQIAPVSLVEPGRSEMQAVSLASTSINSAVQNPLPSINLSPVTSARIAQREVDVHPGPGPGYAAIDKLTDFQEAIAVLAVDQSGRWAFVDPAHLDSKTGWVALDDLQVEGSLNSAPQIFTAWVKSNDAPVRQGPGVFYGQRGGLAIDSLVVALGLNEARSWVLVQSLNGDGRGWTQLRNLTVHAALADLPVVAMPEFQAAADPAAIPDLIAGDGVDNGTIVFQRSSGGEIMVINSDGSGLRMLTHGIDPALSPDGQTVAFTRWEQGEAGPGSLWTIGLDGNNERQVLGFIDKQPKGPAWSPDGSRIVLNFQHEGRLNETTVCHDVSEGRPPSPPPNAIDPGASVDVKGPGVVDVDFCYGLPPDPHWGLRVVNVTDGSFEDVDGGTYAFRPTWDPAQPWRILSDGGRGLAATDINRDVRETLTGSPNDGAPIFSPDGRFIAFTAGQQSGGQGQDIFRMNRDGSGRVRLTETPLWVSLMPERQQKAWNHVAPAWSPNGSQIAFLTDRAGRWEIWVMNADGSNPRPLFSDEINDQLDITYNFVDERVLDWQ